MAAGTAHAARSWAALASSPLLRLVHGAGHLTAKVGGWLPDAPAEPVADPATALVDRLLDRVLDLDRADAARRVTDVRPVGLVVDVAGGRAGVAAAVWRRWPRARIVAIDRNRAALPPSLAGQPALVVADATALPIPDGVADLVLSVEAALHFRSRADFLRHAARVLRPGGRLLLTDLLVDPLDPGWRGLVPAGNDERTADEYAASLRAAGFTVDHIADVTDRTWRPYAAALLAAAAEQPPAVAGAVRDLLAARPVEAYLEAAAHR